MAETNNKIRLYYQDKSGRIKTSADIFPSEDDSLAGGITQEELDSKLRLKTINGEQLIGEGDIQVMADGIKNVKTINGISVEGEGDIVIPAGEKGDKGDKGDTGEGFSIFKTYASAELMEADAANVDEGKFVLIASEVDDPDNAKLYVKAGSGFSFITDLSGAQGIQGQKGDKGDTGEQGPKGDKGDKGDAFTYADFTQEQLEALRGPQGEQGPQGPAGTNGTDGAVGRGLSIKSSGIECSEIGDAYMDNQGHLQVLTGEGEWTDAGTIRGPQGPQGERGYTGPQGAPGYISTFVPNADMATEVGQAYVDENGRLQVCVSVSPKAFEDAGYIRGPQGIQGPKGDKGDKGADGTVKGFYYNIEEVQEVGDAYVDSNLHLQVCTSLDPLTFEDRGDIKGPRGAQGPQGPQGATGATGYVKKFVSDYSLVQEVGDAYVNVNNGHLYVCTSIDPKQFDDVGDIRGPQGLRGYTGEKGDKGDKGDTGNVSAFFFSADEVTEVGQAYLDENGNVQVCTSVDPKTFSNKGSLKGPQGAQGPRGAKGDLGYVKSFVPNAAAVTSVGQAYIDNNNHLQVCISLEPTIEFEDAGVIQGPQGEKGDKGDAFTYADFTEAQLEALRGPQGIQGVQGEQGPKGDTGEGFSIYRTYASVTAMEADAENVAEGKFVLIASNVDDADNAKLYVKGGESFTFLTDLSGAQGIQGPQGPQGIQGVQGEQGPAGQDAVLPSFKTINGESILGSGDITISGGDGGGADAEVATDDDIKELFGEKRQISVSASIHNNGSQSSEQSVIFKSKEDAQSHFGPNC